jgi:hypothetical protein
VNFDGVVDLANDARAAIVEAVAETEPLSGIVRDLPAPAYHAADGMSAGGVKAILRSAAHFRESRLHPSKPTPAQVFGTAVHDGVLEPDTFAQRVVVAPDVNKRTNAGKDELAAFNAAHPGAIVLSPDDFARVRRCVDAVRAHDGAAYLLNGAEREVSLFWRDKQFDVPCRCRYDAFHFARMETADIKTTTDASPEAFARSAATFSYHVQAAHYLSGAEHVVDETPRVFAFICVESEPPHAVAVYAMDAAAILAGQALANRALERYAAARAADAWPSYPVTIQTLALPRWALTLNPNWTP